jgi:hypothetical protein
MSITSPFYLRSSNGSGFIYLHVSDHRISEICLFQDRATFETYHFDIQNLINKASAFQLSEINASVFEDALKQFLERSGMIPLTKALHLTLLPLPTPKQIEQAAILSEALKDDFPF